MPAADVEGRAPDGPDEVHRNTDPREPGGDTDVLSVDEVRSRFARLRSGQPGYFWS